MRQQNEDLKREAVDHRSALFSKILYDEINFSRGPSQRAKYVLMTLAIMGIACSSSVVVSDSAEQALENTKAVFLELMCIGIVVGECWCHERVERIFSYITKCQAKSRYGFAEEDEIMATAYQKAQKETRFSMWIFTANYPTVMLGHGIIAAIKGSSWMELAFPWAVPTQNALVFSASMLFQAVAMGFSHCLGTIALCTYSALPTQICAMFDAVVMGIDRIEERAHQKMDRLGLNKQESMLSCIKESIDHHQELVRELSSIRPYLRLTYSCCALFISLIMACEVLPTLQDDVTVFIAVKASVFLFLQVVCCYVAADRLETVAEQRPMLITALFLSGIKASRQQFYVIMTSSINLLNVLRNIM